MTSLPSFIAIAACDPKGVMGKAGKLPWHYPEDFAHFQNQIFGQVILMGYNTFATLPGSYLEKSTALVFSKKHEIDSQLATPIKDLEDLSNFYKNHPDLRLKQNFVIGGAQIFQLFFENNLIQTALITSIKEHHEGDTYFPLSYLETFHSKTVIEKANFSIIESSR